MEKLSQIEEFKEQAHPKIIFKYLEEKPQEPLLEVIQNKKELVQKYYYPKGEDLLMFYNHQLDHSEFWNFYDAPIELDGKIWPTSEHYFQAQKFPDFPAYQEKIRKTPKPGVAFRMARTRQYKIRPDWEDYKIDAMFRALRAKFSQHKKCRQVLLESGNRPLIEHTKRDSYWADGFASGKGVNMLGKLLMKVREEIQEEIRQSESTKKKQ
eukprot:403367178